MLDLRRRLKVDQSTILPANHDISVGQEWGDFLCPAWLSWLRSEVRPPSTKARETLGNRADPRENAPVNASQD